MCRNSVSNKNIFADCDNETESSPDTDPKTETVFIYMSAD